MDDLPDTVPRKDALTGLFQQDHLFKELSRLLQKQKTEPVEAALALLQLENFYEIRRWVGKSEANLLLTDTARLLSQALPRSVLICRCAHYEFAALLIDESSIHAHALIQRVQQALLSAVSDSIPPQLELKCVVGLAQLTPAVPSAEVMFARARHNLSLVLSRQRQGHPIDADPGSSIAATLPQLLRAIKGDRLQLNFQAIVGLRPDGLQRYEVRCCAPGVGSAPAAALFECANQNALGEHIDRWVISRCAQALSKPAASALRLTVNLTLNTVVSARFFTWLRELLAADSSLAARLVFQISELDLLTAQHHMQFFCAQLEELGIKLSISHFGSTPDPFRYLSLLHAHYVKLDVSLQENLRVDPYQQDRLNTLTARLVGSGLRVVASTVEDMALLPLLWAADVHFVQGFCLQEPATTMEFIFPRQQTLELDRQGCLQRTN